MLNVSICRVKEKASSLMLSGLVLFIDVNDPAGAKAAQPPGGATRRGGHGRKKTPVPDQGFLLQTHLALADLVGATGVEPVTYAL